MKSFRLYHLILAVIALVNYFTGDWREIPLHFYAGYVLAAYMIFRLVFALSKNKSFSFARFRLSLKDKVSLTNSLLLWGIAVSLIGAIASGVALEGGRHIGLSLPPVADRHFWRETHSLTSDLFLILSIAHIALLIYARRAWAFYMIFIEKKK